MTCGMLEQPACQVCIRQIMGILSSYVPSQTSNQSSCAIKQVLQRAAADWERYTHIAFTSRNGIQAFLDALEANNGSSQALTTLRGGSTQTICCALGADAELLRNMGVVNVLVPQEVRFPGAVRLRCALVLGAHMQIMVTRTLE